MSDIDLINIYTGRRGQAHWNHENNRDRRGTGSHRHPEGASHAHRRRGPDVVTPGHLPGRRLTVRGHRADGPPPDRVGRGHRTGRRGRDPDRARPDAGHRHRHRPPRRVGPAVDDRRPGRGRRARRGRRGLVRPDPPPLPPPTGGGPRRPGRCGLTAGPAHAWPRSGRPTRPGPRCPAVSKGWWWPRPRSAMYAASRASTTTGSTRPPTWPPSGPSRTSGSCCSTGPSPTAGPSAAFAAEVAGLRDLPPGLAGAAARPGRRSAHPSTSSAPPCPCSAPSSAGPRVWTSTPQQRRAQALRLVRRGAHHPDRRPPAAPRPRLPCRPGRTSPSPPTTCGC